MDGLEAASQRLLAEARTAVLATVDANGRPRLVPVCFVAIGGSPDRAVGADPWPTLYTPLDEKPKHDADPHMLARVRDILVRPEVSLLVQRWDEDWRRLTWLRLHGRAGLLEPSAADAIEERTLAVAELRAKYPQYEGHDLESRPLIRIVTAGALTWRATDEE